MKCEKPVLCIAGIVCILILFCVALAVYWFIADRVLDVTIMNDQLAVNLLNEKIAVDLDTVSVDLLNDEFMVDLKDKILSGATAVTNSSANSATVEIIIPKNAAITKIYVSIVPKTCDHVNNGSVVITAPEGALLFNHRFSRDLGMSIGTFETTLVQPLCVGSEDAVLTVEALNGNTPVIAEEMTVTVVYCPDYCTD